VTIYKTKVTDVKLSDLEVFSKGSAHLAAVEEFKDISWSIGRIFFISSEAEEERGNHAHKLCKQLFVCVSGKLLVNCHDGENTKNFILSGLNSSLCVPPGIWVTIKMSVNTSIAVITDRKYDDSDYIRDWDQFLNFKDAK